MVRVGVAAVLAVLLGGSPASAQVRLEHKYQEGSKHTDHITVNTQQTLTLNGMALETKANTFLIATTAVGQRAADGTLRLETKFDVIQSEVTIPGGTTIAFDSGNPKQEEEGEFQKAFTSVFQALLKSTNVTVLDEKNRLKTVEIHGDEVQNVGEMYKRQFDPAYRKKVEEQDLARLPDGPVKPGDTWTREQESDLGAGQTMQFSTQYEYQGTTEKNGKTLDKIGVKFKDVKYAIAPGGGLPLTLKKSDLKVASSEGELLFDRELGRIVHSKTKVRIQGDLAFTLGDQELGGTLDLTMENTSVEQP